MRLDKALELVGKQGEKTDSFFNYISKSGGGDGGEFLSDGYFMSLKEIAAEFGVSTERIRQIERKALMKLQHPKRSSILREFLINT